MALTARGYPTGLPRVPARNATIMKDGWARDGSGRTHPGGTIRVVQTQAGRDAATKVAANSSPSVFLDLDTVLLESRWAPRGPELHLRPGIADGLARLRQVAEHLIVLVEPSTTETARRPDLRLEVLMDALGGDSADLIYARCPHGGTSEAPECDCRKPGTGLIDAARAEHGLDDRGGWHIGGDQTGVQAGRSAGLRTIRVGPVGEDHLSAVHRADQDARDLLTAANLVLMEALTAV